MKSGGLSDTEITELKSFPNKNYGKGTKMYDDEDTVLVTPSKLVQWWSSMIFLLLVLT